jgi:selenide,water dikinase
VTTRAAGRRLVLVGGGHAHLEVLRAAARRPFDAELVLVSPDAHQLYSGMMPARLAGRRADGALAFDLPALCRAAGARFVEAAVEHVEAGPAGGAVRAGGLAVEGDAVSLDVGARPTALDVAGAAAHAHAVRPLARWRGLVARADALFAPAAAAAAGGPAPADAVREGTTPPGPHESGPNGARARADGPDAGAPIACCVVGGGAAGVELSLALRARARAAGRAAAVTLVEAGPALLPSWGGAAGRVRRLLERRGVRVLTGRPVARVSADAVELAGGGRVDSALTVWVTGAAAHPWVAASGLPVDAGGFLRVDATLRAADGRAVWGAGDCVALDGAPWVAKAGVYAVREAPVLAHNLRAALAGGSARRYRPQRHFLAALDLADGQAFMRWRGLAAHGPWALALKDAIDERFVRRYHALYAAPGSAPP